SLWSRASLSRAWARRFSSSRRRSSSILASSARENVIEFSEVSWDGVDMGGLLFARPLLQPTYQPGRGRFAAISGGSAPDRPIAIAPDARGRDRDRDHDHDHDRDRAHRRPLDTIYSHGGIAALALPSTSAPSAAPRSIMRSSRCRTSLPSPWAHSRTLPSL